MAEPIPVQKFASAPSLAPTDEQLAEYRASFDPRLVEDWEEYIGDSLESAGMVDEFASAWLAAQARFEVPHG